MKKGRVRQSQGRVERGLEDDMVFALHTVTVIVNESVGFIGPGSIILTVIRLEQASGSWTLTLSNPLTG